MTKAIGILVFTNQAVLEHKKKDGKLSDNRYCGWKTSRFPNKFESFEHDTEYRLYFAVKGQVKGYFIIDDYFVADELHFQSESWKPIENGEILKPSQGWRYYLHDA